MSCMSSFFYRPEGIPGKLNIYPKLQASAVRPRKHKSIMYTYTYMKYRLSRRPPPSQPFHSIIHPTPRYNSHHSPRSLVDYRCSRCTGRWDGSEEQVGEGVVRPRLCLTCTEPPQSRSITYTRRAMKVRLTSASEPAQSRYPLITPSSHLPPDDSLVREAVVSTTDVLGWKRIRMGVPGVGGYIDTGSVTGR